MQKKSLFLLMIIFVGMITVSSVHAETVIDINMGYRNLAYHEALYEAGQCANDNGNPTGIDEISDSAGNRFEFKCIATDVRYRVFYDYINDIVDSDATLIEQVGELIIYSVTDSALTITVAILLRFGAIIGASSPNGAPTCFLGMPDLVLGHMYLC